MSLSAEQFIGSWALVRWRIDYSDGRTTYPFGKDANGQLIYSADGSMSATVSSAGRKTGSEGSVREIDDASKLQAFISYFHYAGSWSVDNESVVHDVEYSLNPEFVGTRQVRKAVFQDADSMNLSAKEALSDAQSRFHSLDWKRVER